MRLNRGELRRDRARASDDFRLEPVDFAELSFGFSFFFVLEFAVDDEADSEEFGVEAGVGLEVCASAAHTNTATVRAKYKNLRNPTTSF